MKKGNAEGVAFYEGNSWYHRAKILREDGTTMYTKRGGFVTAEEAKESYYKYQEEFKKACRKYQCAQKKNDIYLTDYLQFWFEEVFSQRVESTTRMICSYTLYQLILPQIEQDIKLQYVNVDYLDQLLERASKSCKSAGNKSREFLNLAFKESVIQGYLRKNPVEGTKLYKRKKPKVILLNKEKLKVLLAAASEGNWYLEILLALFCGLRKGEIYGLKDTDFDMTNQTVRIQRQIAPNPIIPKGQSKIEQYEIIERPPKTENSYRTLRVPDVVIQELQNRMQLIEQNKEKLGRDYNDHGYISCQKNGQPHSISSFNTALSKICEKNGLPHITVHGLRHMYATILMEQNVSLVKISALLGHSSVNTTFEYYCDVMDENMQIIEFMNNTFLTKEKE